MKRFIVLFHCFITTSQTREKIAILEVEKEDYQERLQRALRDLKRAKMEVRELMSIKCSLKARVTTLEAVLDNLREDNSPSSDQDESSSPGEADFSEPKEKVEMSKKGLEEVSGAESEKTGHSLVSGDPELVKKLNAALEMTEQHKFSQAGSPSKLHNSMKLADSAMQTDFSRTLEKETQFDFSSTCRDEEVQVDTLTDEFTHYKQISKEKSLEVSSLKREVLGSHIMHKKSLKEAEDKIHQLLSIRERLTAENAQLNKKIDELKPKEYQGTLDGALKSIRDLQRSLMNPGGQEAGKKDNDSELLRKKQAEMEEMKQAHKIEIQAIIQKVAKANLKVKEEEAKLTAEIKELKLKLELSQQQLQVMSKTAALSGVEDTQGPKMPESSMVSFMEVESSSLEEGGTWGASVEAVFRGKRVAVRRIAKESLALCPIQTIHKQVSTMAHIHHPNLVLFIAIAMDAPSGLMVLTELLTCSLRQAYQSRLIRLDKLPVLLDVALALNFLHLQKRPIVHNNLSSCSVMVEEGGREGEWKAKLSDIGSTTSLMMLSESKQREVVYSAPELVSNPETCITALDLYSYGVLLCEVATDSLPESSTGLTESIGKLKPTLPQMSCLIQCCLAARPEHRPLMSNMVKKIQNLVVNKIKVP